jgi:hypothetical protein
VTVRGATNVTTGPTMVFWEPNGSIPYAVTPIPNYTTLWQGVVHVAGTPVRVPVIFTTFTYGLLFEETGLAAGTSWSVAVTPLNQTPELPVTIVSTTPSVQFQVPNGTFDFLVNPLTDYRLVNTTGPPEPHNWTNVNGSQVILNGTAETVLVTFIPLYSVVFTETGLPAATVWSVDVNGTTHTSSAGGTTVAFELENGTYPYAIGSLPGENTTWTGLLHIDGAGAQVAVPFTPFTYPVVFDESGLRPGTPWSVTVGSVTGSSTGPSATVELVNGSYTWQIDPVPGYTVDRPSGVVDVDASGARLTVSFSIVNYVVTFAETGLPTATEWSVNLSGTVHRSEGTQIVFSDANGSYPYAVSPIGGFTAPYRGSVMVDGANRTIDVAFSAFTYPVEFEESGLPAGTAWTLVVGNATATTTNASVVVPLPNGTAGFSASDSAGYQGPSPGSVTVTGASPAPVLLSFSRSTGVTIAGLPEAEFAGLASGLLVVVVAVAALLLWRRRRGAAPPPEPPISEGPMDDAPPPSP